MSATQCRDLSQVPTSANRYDRHGVSHSSKKGLVYLSSPNPATAASRRFTKMIKRVLSSLTFALVLTQWGCSDSGPTVQQHLSKAQSLSQAGNLKAAVIEYKNAAQKEPGNAEIRFALGELYLRQGMGPSAEKELLQARQMGMDEERVGPPLGEALLMNGEFKRVQELIDPAAVKTLGKRADLIRMLADAQLGLGQIDEGCKQYGEALELEPKLAAAYWGLARCARMREGPDAARVQYEKALELDPDNPRTRVEFGHMEYGLGNLAAAEKQYSEALQLDADDIPARVGYILTRFLQDRSNLPQADLDRLVKDYPDSPQVRAAQAILAYEAKDYAAAREHATAVLQDMPNHLPSLAVHGRASHRLGDYEMAWRSLSRYSLAHPEDNQIRAMLADSLIHVQRLREALETLAPLIKEGSRDVIALLLAATAQQRNNQPEAARKLIMRALAVDPRSAQAHLLLAQVLQAKQDFAAAQGHLQQAAQLAPDDPQTHYALVQSHMARGEQKQALQVLADMDKRWPGQAQISGLKAQALVSAGDPATARQVLEAQRKRTPKDVGTILALARIDILENKLPDARKQVQAALQQDAQQLQTLLLQSRIAELEGKDRERISSLEQIIKGHPNEVSPRMELSRYFLTQGQGYKALEWARQAEKLKPDAPDVLALLADAQLLAGEKDNALATAQRLATVVLPDQAPIQWQYARLLLAINDNRDEARTVLQRVLRLQPGFLDAQAQLVALDIAERRFNAALEMARKVQTQRPGEAVGHIFEGNVLRAQNRYAAASEAYRRGVDKAGGATALVSLHSTLLLAGEQAEADKVLAGWLDRHPKDIPVRLYRAQAAMAASENARAIAFYEEIQKQQADIPAVLNNLALLYAGQGDKRGLELARKAHTLQPANPHIADTLGWLLLQSSQQAEALPLLRQAYAALPAEPQVAYHLAAALYRSGARDEARTILRKLLEGPKRFPERLEAEALWQQLGG